MGRRWFAGYVGNYLGNYLGSGVSVPVVVVVSGTSGGYTPPRRESITRPDGDWLPRIRSVPRRPEPVEVRQEIASREAPKPQSAKPRAPIFVGPSAAAFVQRLRVQPASASPSDDFGELIRRLIQEASERKGFEDQVLRMVEPAADLDAVRRAREEREIVDLMMIEV